MTFRPLHDRVLVRRVEAEENQPAGAAKGWEFDAVKERRDLSNEPPCTSQITRKREVFEQLRGRVGLGR